MNHMILIGFMGAGKTTAGTAYAREHGLRLVDTDQLIEKAAGMTIAEIFAVKGEEEFRRTETKVLEHLLAEKERLVISVGGGLPLREENRRMLHRLGTVIYLDAAGETVLTRLAGDTTRPLLQGDDVKGRVAKLLAERRPIYCDAADVVVDVNGKTPEEVAAEIDTEIGSRKVRLSYREV